MPEKNLNKAVSFETSLRVPCLPRLNGKNRNRNTRPWSERHILLGSQFIIFTKMPFQMAIFVQFITKGVSFFSVKNKQGNNFHLGKKCSTCNFCGAFFRGGFPYLLNHHLGPGTSPWWTQNFPKNQYWTRNFSEKSILDPKLPHGGFYHRL